MSSNSDFAKRLCRSLVADLLRDVETELIGVKSIRILADYPWIPGKRLRPICFLLSALSIRAQTEPDAKLGSREVRLAAAIELMHEASLVHDDLVDRSTVRRGTPTIQMESGAALALIVGDYMVFRALKLALDSAETTRDIALARQLADTGLDVAHGEIDQLDSYLNRRHEKARASLDYYLEVIGKKTAGFFAGCCYGGAAMAGATEDMCNHFRDYGMTMGLVFQMVDDLMDVMGDSDKALKSLRNNLTEGTVTLPMIHAFEMYPEDQAFQRFIDREELTPEEEDAIYARLAEPDVLDRCRETLMQHADMAREHLGKTPASIFRTGLLDVLEFVLDCSWGGLEGKLK